MTNTVFQSLMFWLLQTVLQQMVPAFGNICNLNTECQWEISAGFVMYNAQNATLANSDRTCGDLRQTTGSFAVLNEDALSGEIHSAIMSANIIDDPAKNTQCLSMQSFHSGSDNITRFMLEVRTEQDDAIHGILNMSLSEDGSWHATHVTFLAPQTNYRLVIRAELAGNESFLAIANITVGTECQNDTMRKNSFACGDGTCVPLEVVCNLQPDCDDMSDETICEHLPHQSMCTFDKGMCGWWDLPSDQFEHFDWTRHKGPSSTKGTGPPFDHTNGTLEGYYMYIESSKWKMLDQATLESPVFPSVPKNTNSRCMFRFYYHMMGRTVGELTIKLLDLCSPQVHNRIPTRVWHKEGQQGKSWLYAEVPITNMTSRYAVHISGTGGFQNQGDIAIDDLSLSPGCFGIDFQSDPVKDISEDREIITIQEFTKDVKFHCQILKDNPPSSVKAPNETSTSDSTKGKLKDNTTVPGATVYISENNGKIRTVYIAVITVSGIAISFILCAAFLCFSFRQRKAQCEQNSHLEMVTTPSDENNPVSSAVQAANFDMQLRCAVTELNPNYDFITAKYPEQQLREIPRNKLKLIRLLGQGAFGEVYEGTLKNMCANVSELSVAVKTLPALSTQQAETDFMMEAVIISKFMHKNVVKCLGVCFEEHPRYIILELLEGGDLKTFLRDSRPKTDQHYFLSMKELVHLSLDVANGCRHLEEKHFVHRDIAARNCLLTTRGEGRIAKIADFGMSRDIYSADYYRKSGKTMLPIKWMPPEAFLDGVFTTKTDVWSFGVLLWEMFTLGYMPYPGQTNSDVMQFVSSGGRLDPPEKCPARLNKIMILCWNSIADIRPTFSEIIELLDMCLQDDEVLNAPVGLCHFAMAESFKDASTLAKSSSYDADNQEIDTTLHSPSPSSAAEFRPHFESQSREPLLMASQDQ